MVPLAGVDCLLLKEGRNLVSRKKWRSLCVRYKTPVSNRVGIENRKAKSSETKVGYREGIVGGATLGGGIKRGGGEVEWEGYACVERKRDQVVNNLVTSSKCCRKNKAASIQSG